MGSDESARAPVGHTAHTGVVSVVVDVASTIVCVRQQTCVMADATSGMRPIPIPIPIDEIAGTEKNITFYHKVQTLLALNYIDSVACVLTAVVRCTA